MLETVLQYGTGTAAAIGQFAAGKTGTTSNYGDAWFVGWDTKYTVAVWVGYPEQAGPDDHRLRRRPGARRHLPGADLARLHALRAGDRTRTRGEQRRARTRQLEHGERTGALDERGAADRAPAPARARPRSGAAPRRAAADHGHRRPRRAPRRAAKRSPAPAQAPRRRHAAAPATPRRAHARRAAHADHRARRRRPATPRPRAGPAAPRRRPTGERAARRLQPRGRGARRARLPATQKRQGSSTAWVIPTRAPSTTAGSRQPRRARADRAPAAAQVAAVVATARCRAPA